MNKLDDKNKIRILAVREEDVSAMAKVPTDRLIELATARTLTGDACFVAKAVLARFRQPAWRRIAS